MYMYVHLFSFMQLVQSGNNLWINGEQLSDTVMAQPITASNNVYSIHLFFKIIKYRKLKTKVLQLSKNPLWSQTSIPPMQAHFTALEL